MKKYMLMLLECFALISLAEDTSLTAPVIKNAMIINGKLNVTVYQTSDNGNWYAEFQMKDSDADETAYVTLSTNKVSSLTSFPHNSYGGRSFCMTTNFTGSADVRVRFISGTSQSAWTEATGLIGYVNAKGTAIGTSTQFKNAVDGDWTTMVDESSNPWIGYDYGTPIRVNRFRVYFRPETPMQSRSKGAQIQYASDASFTDATTVYTLTDVTKIDWTHVTDIVFDTPISARCWRITGSSRSSVCEFEIIPTDVPYKPTFTLMKNDITNFYPIITWQVPSELAATKGAILRATAEAGPFDTIVQNLDFATYSCYTDTTAKVGILYHYKVAVDCNHPNFPGQTATSTAVTYRRYRRLDRSWDDQTKLLGNCTILPPTNNTAVITQKAFDGNTGTFPDYYKDGGKEGPVGLNFGETVWVTAFGYVCRNDNWCYIRIQNARLYCSEADDIERTNKILCSDYVSQLSQTATFYYQACTNTPEAGAPCWFLHGSDFCLNVAELAFFGWTKQDLVDAGILMPATDLAITRKQDGSGVNVTWTAGVNHTGYRLERRIRGTDAWTVAVANIGKDALACSDTYDNVELANRQNVWEYRLVSVDAQSEETCTATLTYTYYLAGSGTGLSGALYAPFKASVASKTCPAWVADLPVGAVNLDLTAGEEIVSGSGVTKDARLLWRGTIIIPMTGTYSFTLTTTDGGAVNVNNTWVCNSWTGGSRTPSGQITLSAGEYSIEVDARLENYWSDGVRKCILSWGGTVPSEVVPATQLKPAAQPPRLQLGDWTIRSFNGAKLGRVTKTSSYYEIEASPEDPTGKTRDTFQATAMMKPWRYSFDASARVDAHLNGRAGIMARGKTGNFFAVVWDYDGQGYTKVELVAMTNGADKIVWPIGKLELDGFSNEIGDVRLIYDSLAKDFTAYWRDDDTNKGLPTTWQLLGTMHNNGDIEGEYEYGYFVTGKSANDQASFRFTNVSEKTSVSRFIIIIR